ncbi:MAG: DUF2914 domain-containing protein [Gammaproteobacteria bacterium]|nr:DUF2914 domain-containing protein [Gammaproteobacteria bacterium]
MHNTNNTIFATLCAALLLTAGAAQAQNTPTTGNTPAAATTAPAAAAAAPAPKAAATASVARAQFTTAINNREPADAVTSLDNNHGRVFFFTDVKNGAGQTLTHRWEFGGKTVAELQFEPKANRWRYWSSKTLMPDQTGTWTAEVVDGSGNVLISKSFDYTKAPPPAAAPTAATSTPAPAAATHGGGR